MPEDYDVVVIGGGPGGSTASSLLALDGRRVLLLDKEQFPRYQIGESLLPSTIHGICPMIGVEDEIKSAGFPVKHGGTFRWGANPEPWTFAFEVSPEMPAETGFAYQVERVKFDTILLENAKRLGVEVKQRHQATGVLREDDRVCGVRYVDDQGESYEARATFVVDASGHTGRLHNEVGGERVHSPFFRHLALFGYFSGGKRLPQPNSGNILSVAFKSGWFWYIPLRPDLTSVGAVVRDDMVEKIQGDPEVAYRALIDECPLIKDYLGDTPRATEPPYDRLRVRKDWSYAQTTLHSPGMLLVGDAACFIDPVFSQGVHLATYSGMLAARTINSILAGLDEDRCLREFEGRYRREFSLFHDFLVSFYGTNQEAESYFWEAKKVTGEDGAAAEAFVNLIGGIASRDFNLGPRKPDLTERITDGVTALTDAQAHVDSTGDARTLHSVPVVSQALGEALKLRASRTRTVTETPLLEGGLIASADGRRWEVPAA